MRFRNKNGNSKTECSKCNEPLEEELFMKSRYCRKCKNEAQRKNRKNHSELNELERKKANARSYLNVYIRRGIIKKEPCVVCGSEKAEAHHDDYDKPLRVFWLCKKHHIELHSGELSIHFINSLKPTSLTFKNKVKNREIYINEQSR